MFLAESPLAAAFDAVVLGCGLLGAFMVLIIRPAASALGEVYEPEEHEQYSDAAETVAQSTEAEEEDSFIFGQR